MKKIAYLLFFCLFAACSNDEEKAYLIGTDRETEAWLANGLVADAEATTIVLGIKHLPGRISTICHEDWIEISQHDPEVSPTTTDIVVKISGNDGWERRQATLTISTSEVARKVVITQRAKDRMQPKDAVSYIGNEGGEFPVDLKANVPGEIKVSLSFDNDKEWLAFEGVILDHLNPQNPECGLHFKALPNNGTGRICGVKITAEGSKASTEFCIIQQPRQFNEEETINIENAGTLDVLLGSDINNIRNIRRVTLTGQMNGLDWTALRRFFYKGVAADPKPEEYPVVLDLADVVSVYGDRSYYHSYGYKSEDAEFIVSNDYEIPDHALERCVNLMDIILPKTTIKIGNSALANNKNLKAISIPDNVEIIEYGAFQGCHELSHVDISDSSSLRRLGRYAFSGCGPIEFMNLPISLTDTDGGHLSIPIKEMKVHWPVPPELRVPPTVKEGGKLYVPKGSASLYRETAGWNRFPVIEEYE